MKESGNSNRLIGETSPYLLQHARNPVDWYPWGDEALERAREKDQPILVSIGYSSCHWCHVMERESFENEDIARYMNENFTCIKVDREERPDVDQIYMDAVQAMGVHGGWPLNVFLTPDQKPFYGGTYFQPQSWLQLLKNVAGTFKSKRQELEESADRLAQHISKSDVLKFDLAPVEDDFLMEKLTPAVENLRERFDLTYGGLRKAPKFPMPTLWTYLLRYSHFKKDAQLHDHVIFTLEKMVHGGIYDQAGGGFSRYSVDAEWFAPHFEKMLYDNGQLMSLYSEAWLTSGKPVFKEAVYDTGSFIKRELMSPEGAFYSALDADSEGEEGKYYTWTTGEFEKITGNEKDIWSAYFGVTEEGNWESGRNILTRNQDEGFLENRFIDSPVKPSDKLREIKSLLLREREKRIRPGLDNKVLAGWNGMMMKGLIDASLAFGEKEFLELALQNARYLKANHYQDGILYRTPLGVHYPIPGYLEDYAFVIHGLITLYQATFDEEWLFWARDMIGYTTGNFYDEKENLFYFSSERSGKLIARKKEIFDNVIPSSNSEMAINLFLAGELFGEETYTGMAEKMIRRMMNLLFNEPEYLTNWGKLYLMFSNPFAEIAIVGKDPLQLQNQMAKHYIPNKVFCGTASASRLPLLRDKKITEKNTIFVCYDKACKLPVNSAGDALKLIQ
ncbi:MAG: thioredoxin domain-containing protein [Cyclobacteriaceae bacterium]|nr:thioredoxin domain-containing protein [Cyclobacteriaceae bacterium]